MDDIRLRIDSLLFMLNDKIDSMDVEFDTNVTFKEQAINTLALVEISRILSDINESLKIIASK